MLVNKLSFNTNNGCQECNYSACQECAAACDTVTVCEKCNKLLWNKSNFQIFIQFLHKDYSSRVLSTSKIIHLGTHCNNWSTEISSMSCELF